MQGFVSNLFANATCAGAGFATREHPTEVMRNAASRIEAASKHDFPPASSHLALQTTVSLASET